MLARVGVVEDLRRSSFTADDADRSLDERFEGIVGAVASGAGTPVAEDVRDPDLGCGRNEAGNEVRSDGVPSGPMELERPDDLGVVDRAEAGMDALVELLSAVAPLEEESDSSP